MSDFERDALAPADAELVEWCHDAVQDVSRTFAISIGVLDDPMATYVCVGYLLCRVPDTVEDAAHIPGEEKARLLRQYDAALDPEADADTDAFLAAVEPWVPDDLAAPADWGVVEATGRVFDAYALLPGDVRAAMRPPIRELATGMADFCAAHDDAGGLRISTVDELEEYCYYVAGTIGHLITNIVGLDADKETERTLRDRAEGFGLLLQLVNIAKDVHEDYHEENNVYVPEAWLDEHGVPQDDLLAEEHREGAVAAVNRTIDRARSYLNDAHAYLEHLPERGDNTRSASALPFLLAVATLRELEANAERALERGSVSVTREEVFALLHAVVGGDADLDSLRQHVSERPYGA